MARTIGVQLCAFLLFEVENGDPRRKKAASQSLCQSLRGGMVLPSGYRERFERAFTSQVLVSNQDIKVARWCLNALALLGRREISTNYVQSAIRQYEQYPEIVGAGIAALASMYRGRVDAIPGFESIAEPHVRKLAALQYTDPQRLDLTGLRIDIERVSAEVLKLALIVVGMNREVQNLFHPRHSNNQIVKVLGQHPDPIVVQYSVWAIIENATLSIGDLGVSLDQLDSYPPNVQAKVFHLVAQRETDFRKKHELIDSGALFVSNEARIGLAKGLLHCFYDGLEGIVIPWFRQEAAREVKELLAEHMSRHAEDCGPYEREVLDALETSPELKNRIVVGSEGTRGFALVRNKIADLGMRSMFDDQYADLFPSAQKMLTEREQMKVLFLTANPDDLGRIRPDVEARNIKEKVALVSNPQTIVEFQYALAVRVDQIQDEILNCRPVVLHFSGHGGPAKLCFEDKNGESFEVDGAALAGLIKLTSSSIRCVVVNACFSDSIASVVVSSGVSVVGYTAAVPDEAAILFSQGFYRALAHGNDFQRAFEFAQNELDLNGFNSEKAKYTFKSH